MKNKSILLLSLLLIGCTTNKYKLAYSAIDYLANDYLSKELLVEEAYYSKDNESIQYPHVIINYSFINMYNQRTERYFLYVNDEINEDSKNSNRHFEATLTTSYYVKLDIEKLNEYIKEKN